MKNILTAAEDKKLTVEEQFDIYIYDRKLYYLKKLNNRIRVPNKFMSLNSTKA